jgi:putative oxidoreductase
MKDILDLLGRILISIIFYFEAYDKIFFITSTKKSMTEYGITWNQDMLLNGSAFCLILGATLILLGYRSAFGAWLILFYWIPLTIILNKFWEIPLADHETRRSVSLHFMKNIAIVGGLLIVIVNGSGKYSVKRLLATTRV